MSNIIINKKFVDYGFQDFVADEYFVEWVKSPGENTNHFWEKWLEINPHKRQTVLEAADFVRSLHYKRTVSLTNDDYIEIFENIIKAEKEVNDAELSVQQPGKWYSFFSVRRVAAILLVCFFSWAIYENKNFSEQSDGEIEWISKRADSGKKILVGLSDGTKVYLNSNSEIKYPSSFSDTLRAVYLKGEAYFEVEKEMRPFVVELGEAKVEVLGTSFNVNHSLENRLTVALVSGKVKVNDYAGNQVMLAPSEMLVMDETGKFFKSPFDSLEITGWKDNNLIFRNNDFPSVKRKLETWYGIEITVHGEFKKGWSYTGEYHDESLQNVLKGIQLTSNINFKIKDNKVDIYNNHKSNKTMSKSHSP
ncbi:FecR family protein [Algoriphagus sp. D3-2-R+10]|uniref:FecR family protein n=1 Tax=Algoriphagus aurantiacus TaxID=3103948 RepID=UPI002B3BFF9F|nr:FecR family protein [Algoriphagus sp. D3-2-R+10]MEB2778517.1 FecR family protein [Algoriphagus sp. D3-2-R+10]